MSLTKPDLNDLRIHRPAQTGDRGYGWLWLALLLLVAVGGAIWWFTRPQSVQARTVAARAISSQPGERAILNASGYVTARRAATVSSKVTGKVLEVLVEEGMHVKEGQVLARLDQTNVRASHRQAEAQLAAARAALEETRVRIIEAERELKRVTDLAAGGFETKRELERAEAAALSLKARLAQQAAQVEVNASDVAAWEQQLEDTVIRAPFSGVVTSKNAQPGEMISPVSAGGGFTRTGICTIVDMESLEIEIDVNESYIDRVRPQQPVEATLDAYATWKIPCTVIAIIPTADRQKSTVKVRVGFAKLDPRILPEMSVKVAFRELATGAAAGTRIAIPKRALRQLDGKDTVFVVVNGKAERRAVFVESASTEEVVVSAGLTAGDRVITEAQGELADGSRIRLLEP
jgi:RND family efflux transporter MFP subunit